MHYKTQWISLSDAMKLIASVPGVDDPGAELLAALRENGVRCEGIVEGARVPLGGDWWGSTGVVDWAESTVRHGERGAWEGWIKRYGQEAIDDLNEAQFVDVPPMPPRPRDATDVAVMREDIERNWSRDGQQRRLAQPAPAPQAVAAVDDPRIVDPMSKPFWDYFETLTWVHIRRLDAVADWQRARAALSNAERRLPSVILVAGHFMDRFQPHIVNIVEVQNSIVQAIQSGRLCCLGVANGIGDHMEIPEAHRADMRIHDLGDERDGAYIAPVDLRPGATRWRELRFKRDELIREWPDAPAPPSAVAALTEADVAENPPSLVKAAARGRPAGVGSLAGLDSPLIAEMHAWIGEGDGRSTFAAAQRVAERAAGGGTLESKVKRLAARYSEKFRRNSR